MAEDIAGRLGRAYRDQLALAEEHDGAMETGVDEVRESAGALYDLYLGPAMGGAPQEVIRGAFVMGATVGFKAGESG